MPSAGDYWLNIQALGATATLVVDGNTITTVGAGFGTSPRYGVVHPTDGSAPTATTDGLANNSTLLHLTAGAHTLKVTDTPDVSGRAVQVRLNWVTPQQQQAITTPPSPPRATPRPRSSSPGTLAREIYPPRCPTVRIS